MDGNGVTRREFEDLKRELADLDRYGSRATAEVLLRLSALEKRLDKSDSNWTWLARGIIGVIFLVISTILVLALSGVFNASG